MSNDRERATDRLARAFRDSLLAAEAEAPSFEDVAAYVEGRLQGAERSLFEERMAGDPLLRAEVQDLRELRGEMKAGAAPAWMRWAAAAAVIAALGGGWLWLRQAGDSEEPRVAGGAGSAPVASVPDVVARLNDTSGVVALRADGSVEGIGASLQAPAASALRSGTLRVAPLRKDLAVSRVVPMGVTGPDPVFFPLGPRSTLVRSDRPTLRWGRHEHAMAYVVSIYDLDLNLIAASPRLTAHEWTPEKGLPRQRTYVWQVEAFTTGPEGREITPVAPEPEARFHVAGGDLERETRDALAAAGPSHLAAAIVLAERGFVDEATRELDALAGLNPGSSEVERLRAALLRPAR